MTHADATMVRELTGNMGITTLPSSTITNSITFGDSLINTFTGKSDWDSLDVEYGLVQMAANLFAAAFCLKRFGGAAHLDKAKELENEAYEIAGTIRKNSALSFLVVSQAYRSNPLNPDATPYTSISGGSTGIDDSDL